ncbi:MAG: SDR family NAD(P)-dependent oxidoreductase [Ardenticatenaceae bacterium]
MTTLAGINVLITGASGGFGQEMIRQFLQAGSRVVVTDLSQDKLEAAVAKVRETIRTGKVLGCIESDLSTRAGCEQLFADVQALGVEVEVLVNNAGIAQFGRLDQVPADKWEMLMQVNLLAPMRLSSLFIPGMIARQKGHLVNISSMAGWVGPEGLAPYAASKFGLRGFGEALHEELKPHNIKVTNVYPFFSRTPILDSPGYGSLPRQKLPDKMITDPVDVIGEVIKGIREDKLHIFPDKTAKQLHMIRRFVPWALPYVNRRMG